jgi:hypothetical protein
MEGAPRWGGSPGRYSMFRNGWPLWTLVLRSHVGSRENSLTDARAWAKVAAISGKARKLAGAKKDTKP